MQPPNLTNVFEESLVSLYYREFLFLGISFRPACVNVFPTYLGQKKNNCFCELIEIF